MKYVIDYTAKDYDTLRAAMITNLEVYLPEYTNREDNDFGIFLLEQVAVLGDILSFYEDRIANEMFFETAKLKESVTDLSAFLGYIPKQAHSAFGFVHVEINAQGTLSTIPLSTSFGAVTSSGKITFETTEISEVAIGEIHPYQTTLLSDVSPDAVLISLTDTSDYAINDLVILNDNTNIESRVIINKAGSVLTLESALEYGYLASATKASKGISAVQGVQTTDETIGASDGTEFQKFKLLGFPLTINGVVKELIVQVNEGGGYSTWSEVDWFLDSSNSDIHYRVVISDKAIWILFGDGTTGKIPTNTGVVNIRASYKVGGGEVGNVPIGAVSIDDSGLSFMKSVTNLQVMQGGQDSETVDEIKESARVQWQTRGRAVTLDDYHALCEKYPGVEEASREFISPDTVNLYVRPLGGGYPSSALKSEISSYFSDVGVLGIVVIVNDPIYVPIDITADLVIEYGFTPATVIANVNSALVTFFEELEFNESVAISDVYAIIDKVEGTKTVTMIKLTRDGLSEITNITIAINEIGEAGTISIQEEV